MAVSIKDVGRLAGVSVSTVSRAFNGYSDINPVTKQRILEAAEALGYSPNISARNLSSKKKAEYRIGHFRVSAGEYGAGP